MDDLSELSRQLGYHWPDDSEGQIRVLKLMAGMAAHWRAEVDKCRSELWPQLERDKAVAHQSRRIAALAKKLGNTRRALRDYMKSQAAFVREGLAEIKSRR